MKALLQTTVLTILVITSVDARYAFAAKANPVVRMTTSMGSVEIELYADKAPVTVKNFLDYTKQGHYNGAIFHRVIKGFMIQGGGFTPDMMKKQTRARIRNEADNGLKNLTGTIAMARTKDPHSAQAQFFINTADNDSLNHRDKTEWGWGYAVFGKVIKGMGIVRKIENTPTGVFGGYTDVPKKSVVIQKMELLSKKKR